QSWNALVLSAATNYLMVQTPTNLTVTGTGTLYRVTVTTSQGTGNGVGCSVAPISYNTFQARPRNAYILMTPGASKAAAIIGGGTPPYSLFPQSTSDVARVVGSVTGPVLNLFAPSNSFGSTINVSVQDSSVSTQYSTVTVYVLKPGFAPTFDATFHTL